MDELPPPIHQFLEVVWDLTHAMTVATHTPVVLT
jgi:hypothetical protein